MWPENAVAKAAKATTRTIEASSSQTGMMSRISLRSEISGRVSLTMILEEARVSKDKGLGDLRGTLPLSERLDRYLLFNLVE